ncbi:MAG: AIR synthase-related protein, partial [Pseudomonadota bacterium]
VGDVIIGLASDGIHSNGYSLVRKILEVKNIDIKDPANAKLAEDLLKPTRLYVKSCLQAIKAGGVHALAHITGGGITENTPRVLPENTAARINRDAWQIPEIFNWLQTNGNVAEDEMLRTFNCGIGMILVVAANKAANLQAILKDCGETVFILGEIINRQDAAVEYI